VSQGKDSPTITKQFSADESLVMQRISHGFRGKRVRLNEQVVETQLVQHSSSSCHVPIVASVPVVQRLQRAGHVDGSLGAVDPGLRRLLARPEELKMSDGAIFISGLVRAPFALEPLTIAALSEVREEEDQNQDHL
jgi:hypothetical protein